ncbi:hypothetical protein [Paenisporosarcina indica]|uniref:hypothetical protein n=1 Tax=Paenisporosarcina indica TaxID=650093 RepID=UPI0009501E99|nr:hypothetical protein [Paenisporosarcina indica]
MKNYEARHVFMLFGICILLVSPVFILLVPLTVVATKYDKLGAWITYTPGANYLLFGLGVILISFASLIVFFLNLKKGAIVGGLICTILSGIAFYSSSLPYVTLTNDEISFRKVFSLERQTYSWDDLDRFVYYETPQQKEETPYYEFYFTDGNMLSMYQNGHFTEVVQKNVHSKVMLLGIPVEHIHDY